MFKSNVNFNSLNTTPIEDRFMDTFMRSFMQEFADWHEDCVCWDITLDTISAYGYDGYTPHTDGGIMCMVPSDYSMALSERTPNCIHEGIDSLMRDAESDFRYDAGIEDDTPLTEEENEKLWEYSMENHLATSWFYQVRIYKERDGRIIFDICVNTDEYGRENHNCYGNHEVVFKRISENLTEENIKRLAERVHEEVNREIWNW